MKRSISNSASEGTKRSFTLLRGNAHANDPRYCRDCRQDVAELKEEHFMLRDNLWYAAGFGAKDLACIACLEARLGRRLEPNHFTAAPINGWVHTQSQRLQDRIAWDALSPKTRAPGVDMLLGVYALSRVVCSCVGTREAGCSICEDVGSYYIAVQVGAATPPPALGHCCVAIVRHSDVVNVTRNMRRPRFILSMRAAILAYDDLPRAYRALATLRHHLPIEDVQQLFTRPIARGGRRDEPLSFPTLFS